jgi:hypothetical protein
MRSEQLSRKLSACCGRWVELVAMMPGSGEVMGSGGGRRAQSRASVVGVRESGGGFRLVRSFELGEGRCFTADGRAELG